MQMEDHHLRQLLNGKPINFQPINPHDTTTDLLFSPAGHRNLQPPQQQPHHHHHQHHHQPFDMTQMVGIHSGVHHEYPSDSTNGTPTDLMAASASTLSPSCGFDGDGNAYGGDGGTGRWPRQETLTLLEIRSRLDTKFKDANQKGPLWDEVSRIMFEEHGYQRSGKKCREKFENLYKYYKKTKEGKAGRQDGKHYRFFRQLEALYGENTTSNNNGVSCQEISPVNNFQPQRVCESLSLSNSSKFETSSSDNTDLNDKKKGCRGLKSTIKEFVDSQMSKLMERQEAWLVKLTRTLEEKEEERVSREERWRQEEANRIDKEHKFWAKERAWIEARDAALMEALHNLSNKATSSDGGWLECEVSKLIQVRTAMETRFEQESEVLLWEEISAKMSCLGFEKSGSMCKDKWDSISSCNLMKTKKRKENSRGFDYNNLHHHHQQQQQNEAMFNQGNEGSNSHGVSDSCFRFFMADGENLWENYGLKLSN